MTDSGRPQSDAELLYRRCPSLVTILRAGREQNERERAWACMGAWVRTPYRTCTVVVVRTSAATSSSQTVKIQAGVGCRLAASGAVGGQTTKADCTIDYRLSMIDYLPKKRRQSGIAAVSRADRRRVTHVCLTRPVRAGEITKRTYTKPGRQCDRRVTVSVIRCTILDTVQMRGT